MYHDNFRHQPVRDLAWAIASPPLMVDDDSECHWYRASWYRELYSDTRDWLYALDEQPHRLQQKLDAEKDRRMGRYFETLWAFWIEYYPRFELLQQNLALRDAGRTLGELDFLVLDKATGLHLHWELAVKFYLGIGDTRYLHNWYGPACNDRLDRKLRHLQTRQSVISAQPEARAMLADRGIRVDHCGVILKGRLFYRAGGQAVPVPPGHACRDHERGQWFTLSQFCEAYGEHERFTALLGYGWMAPPREQLAGDYFNKNSILEMVSAGRYRTPLYLGQHPENTLAERIFLVADDWDECR